jgi:hypothetical protein
MNEKLRAEVMAHMTATAAVAIERGEDGTQAVQAWWNASQAATERWWQAMEKTIDADVIQRASRLVGSGGAT